MFLRSLFCRPEVVSPGLVTRPPHRPHAECGCPNGRRGGDCGGVRSGAALGRRFPAARGGGDADTISKKSASKAGPSPKPPKRCHSSRASTGTYTHPLDGRAYMRMRIRPQVVLAAGGGGRVLDRFDCGLRTDESAVCDDDSVWVSSGHSHLSRRTKALRVPAGFSEV
jgi:hypothetical protein